MCVRACLRVFVRVRREPSSISPTTAAHSYMLRMVNNVTVVGKSFDTIMHMLGVAKDQLEDGGGGGGGAGSAAGGLDSGGPLVLDFGCEQYAQERDAAAKHADAANSLEAARVQDARRGIEVGGVGWLVGWLVG